MKELDKLVIDIMNDTIHRKFVSPKNFIVYRPEIHYKGVKAINQYVIKAKGEMLDILMACRDDEVFERIEELRNELKRP